MAGEIDYRVGYADVADAADDDARREARRAHALGSVNPGPDSGLAALGKFLKPLPGHSDDGVPWACVSQMALPAVVLPDGVDGSWAGTFATAQAYSRWGGGLGGAAEPGRRWWPTGALTAAAVTTTSRGRAARTSP